MADFEQGAYLAVQEVFPGVDLEGCYFHLSKSIDSHVKKLGLSRKYDADFDFRIRVNKLSALAFIPLADLVSTFESLASEFLDDELALLSYLRILGLGNLCLVVDDYRRYFHTVCGTFLADITPALLEPLTP